MLGLLSTKCHAVTTMNKLGVDDIRAVNHWGWMQNTWDGFSYPKPEKYWTIIHHEIQVRDAVGKWCAIPVIDLNKDGTENSS